MPEQALEPLRSAPSDAGLFIDFDGTLSEIVDSPEMARPAPGVIELLHALSRRLKLVAIVSGRSTHQLVEWLGPDIEIWGLHGAERSDAGQVVLSHRAVAYEELMPAVAAEARAALALDGIQVEDKGAMVGLHYRQAPDRASAEKLVAEVAQDLADRHGLIVGTGRLVVELRPPLGFSKAAVILERTRESGLAAVAFVGDDIVDLPAFDALDELAAEGVATVKVAVNSSEAPAELLRRADIVVEGPSGVVTLLRGLLD